MIGDVDCGEAEGRTRGKTRGHEGANDVHGPTGPRGCVNDDDDGGNPHADTVDVDSSGRKVGEAHEGAGE